VRPVPPPTQRAYDGTSGDAGGHAVVPDSVGTDAPGHGPTARRYPHPEEPAGTQPDRTVTHRADRHHRTGGRPPSRQCPAPVHSRTDPPATRPTKRDHPTHPPVPAHDPHPRHHPPTPR